MAKFQVPNRKSKIPNARSQIPVDHVLLRVVDWGLGGSVFLVPLLMGGRQALGQLALVLLAVTVALAWTLGQCLGRRMLWRSSSAEVLLLAGLLLLLLQLSPLPETLLERVSPHTAEILPLWASQGDGAAKLGTWSCISMTPAATRAALAVFLAYCLLFLVTVQRIRSVEDVERVLRWIALSATLMAGFGLVQLVTSNGKFFWFYEHPFSRTVEVAKGSFTNRNHFAHFLALGIGPLIWWLQSSLGKRAARGPVSFAQCVRDFQLGKQAAGLGGVALGIVLFAGLLSLSRGGVAVMLLAAAISVAVCCRAKRLGPRFVLCLGPVVVLIGLLLCIHGYDRVSNRLDDLSSGSLQTLDAQAGRQTIWAAVIKATADYALLGAGVGSHRDVYPVYLEQSLPTVYTHAENGPLQVLLETGAVGLVLVLSGVGFCFFWCIGAMRKAASSRLLVCGGAIFASLVANVVHSTADFVWYVPGCMVVVVVLAGCACRVWQLAAEGESRRLRGPISPVLLEPLKPAALPGFVGLAAAVALVVVGTWMVTSRFGPVLAEPHWDQYQILALAATESGSPRVAGAEPRVAGAEPRVPGAEPSDAPAPETTDPADDGSLDTLTRMIFELQEVVRQQPDHFRAHLALAAAYLRRFDLLQQSAENAMALAQIRDAAIGARFSTREAVEEWLSRAVGAHRADLKRALWHARCSLALCPLQGEGYLYLAELCFLEGTAGEAAKRAYIDQALRVRPFDGNVLFEAGREAWLAGDFSQGVDFWQRSFRSGRGPQEQLIQLLAGRIPPSAFVEIFQPDLVSLRLLHRRYCELKRPDELAEVRGYYARAARAEAQNVEGAKAAKHWLEAGWVFHLLEDEAQAAECARTALRIEPNDFNGHYGLATSLIATGQYAEAEQHLQWCSQRQPNNRALQKTLKEVVKKRLNGEDSPATAGQTAGVLR